MYAGLVFPRSLSSRLPLALAFPSFWKRGCPAEPLLSPGQLSKTIKAVKLDELELEVTVYYNEVLRLRQHLEELPAGQHPLQPQQRRPPSKGSPAMATHSCTCQRHLSFSGRGGSMPLPNSTAAIALGRH